MVNDTFRALAIAALCTVAACTAPRENNRDKIEIETAKTLTGLSAGVACAHPEAARIGALILAKGGNAVDAAVAVQWALAAARSAASGSPA